MIILKNKHLLPHFRKMTKCKRIPDLENKKCKKTLYLQNVKK